MRSKKLCYILLSALFIMLGLSLNVCLDTSAKQYDVVSIPYSTPYGLIPTSTKIDPDTGNLVVDWDNYSPAWSGSAPAFNNYGLEFRFLGDSYYSELSDLKLSNSLYKFSSTASSLDSLCRYSTNSFNDIFDFTSSSSSLTVSANLGQYQYPQTPLMYISSLNRTNGCRYHFPFGQSPQQSFQISSLPGGFSYWDIANLLPYYYTSDGLFLNSKAIDSNSGIHYSHSFKFSDLFNQNIKQFSRLTIPIWNYDDFWIDGNNFTEGREIEFKGIFNFTESFSFHENINTNGSSISVHFIGYKGNNSWEQFDIPCTNRNTILPDGSYYLEYSCKYYLPHQYVWVYPALVIDGHNNYFWTTNGDTTYAQSWFITDNDTTPGGRLGDNLSGNYIIGDAKNDIGSSGDDSADWFSSLKNLFNFNIINPFAPIFSLFTSQESCAQIPTLSEFLHSEETQVCPFFSSRIRSVVTPVLGLSAMMLVFGFAVRWLGARSGNFFEDSGSIAPPGDFPAGSAGVKHVGWRRK